MTNEQLIVDLGGTRAVAKALGQKDSAVSMWKLRGVPWRWRPAVVQLAQERGVRLPEGFLLERLDGTA